MIEIPQDILQSGEIVSRRNVKGLIDELKLETSSAYSSVLMSASSLSGVNGLLFAIAREANSSVAAAVDW